MNLLIKIGLIALLLIPINGTPYILEAFSSVTEGFDWVTFYFPMAPFKTVVLAFFYWSMLWFVIWMAFVVRFYWQKIYGELESLSTLKNLHLKPDPQPVSVIIPAFNEEKTIIQTIRACQIQTWKPDQIIIIDDGSKDKTSELIISECSLTIDEEAKNRISRILPHKGDVISVHTGGNITLIRKENAGKGYALNIGIELCKNDFICLFDADTIPDPDGIEGLITPMLLDSEIKLVSGRNQFINGCKVENGRVVQVSLSKNPLLISQSVEFFNDIAIKAFRNSLNAQTVLIGNFSAYRRDIVYTLGGFAERGVTEDYDFNQEVQERRTKGDAIKIVSVLSTRGWTQAPYSASGYLSQRSRWAAGVLDSMMRRSGMLFNEATGAFGNLIMPLQWYKVITMLPFSLIRFVATPVILYMWGTDLEYNLMFNDVVTLFIIPSYIYECIVEPIIISILDWKFIKSYESKRTYVFLVAWKMLFSYLYEALQAACTFVGYIRTIRGTAVWGKSERTKVDQ